jgi:hypothetical protein
VRTGISICRKCVEKRVGEGGVIVWMKVYNLSQPIYLNDD